VVTAYPRCSQRQEAGAGEGATAMSNSEIAAVRRVTER
jgi:hypothetical protein